jgi:hypothetical protein
MEKTKSLVLTYFKAWQNKDWDTIRSCVAKDFKIDGGQLQFQSIETFIEFCKTGPSWSQVRLLDSLFQENKAALLFEGTTPEGQKIRIGEFFEIKNEKIAFSRVAISLA